MANGKSACGEVVCRPAEEHLEKVWTELNKKVSMKFLISVAVPIIVFFFSAIGTLSFMSLKTQQQLAEKIFDKVSETNAAVGCLASEIKSIQSLGDKDSQANRERIDRLERWKETQVH